jgi:hypothetical protein
MRTLPLALLLPLAACSSGESPEGSWKGVDEPNVITFGAGGEFKQVSYGTTYTGTWKRTKPDEIDVVFTGDSARLPKTTIRISFDKEVLTTTNSAGRTQRWKRP